MSRSVPVAPSDRPTAGSPQRPAVLPEGGVAPAPGGPQARLAAAMRSYQLALDVFDDGVAAVLGINRTDLRCLDILDRHQPMTAGALARATRLTTGAITFALDRLEAAGFVRRRRDDDDRRRVLVELVPSAQQRVQALHVPMVVDARQSLSGLSDGEVELVCRFLEASTGAFERNVPGVPGAPVG